MWEWDCMNKFMEVNMKLGGKRLIAIDCIEHVRTGSDGNCYIKIYDSVEFIIVSETQQEITKMIYNITGQHKRTPINRRTVK